MLAEIGIGRASCSRGLSNPRAVKRKMSGYPLRKRGQPLRTRLNIRLSVI
jgi:hypothetical protein